MIANLLIGAGAMKAGSTWLYKQLEKHPNIHLPRKKKFIISLPMKSGEINFVVEIVIDA